jgi:hypothetical protein
MNDDPIVSQIRGEREKLAAAFDFNVHAIFEVLRKREAAVGERLIRQSGARMHSAAASKDDRDISSTSSDS